MLAHGNYVGAAILADQPDLQLPDRLAAIATHLAAAGATAVTFALADDGDQLDAVATQFKLVAAAACAVHGLPAQSPATARRTASTGACKTNAAAACHGICPENAPQPRPD